MPQGFCGPSVGDGREVGTPHAVISGISACGAEGFL